MRVKKNKQVYGCVTNKHVRYITIYVSITLTRFFILGTLSALDFQIPLIISDILSQRLCWKKEKEFLDLEIKTNVE